MEYQGRINKLFPQQQGKSAAGKEWVKQDFIFEYFEHETDRWSDKVLLSLMNERVTAYDLHEGDEVKVGFSHSVREWNGKWFNEMRVYKLEKVVKDQQPAAQPPSQENANVIPF